MHFWWKGAQAVAQGLTVRCGLIAPNSIRQIFSGRVVADAINAKKPIHLAFAVPDHPWSAARGAAAVRISMTVVQSGHGDGVVATVASEDIGADDVPEVTLASRRAKINPDLTIGVDAKDARSLVGNEGVGGRGMSLHGSGFLVTPSAARSLGYGRRAEVERHIRPFLNGRDFQQQPRGLMVIDLFGLSEDQVRKTFPAIYQHVLLHVKPERDQNNRQSYRERWWIFGEPRSELRAALSGLTRYIVTPFASKHRLFAFEQAGTVPDNMLVCFGLDDAFYLGVLSSRFHVQWTLAVGGTLEDRPLYSKTACFDAFPFPRAEGRTADEIRSHGSDIDAHRKARIAAHPHLTLTSLYNVLQKVRAGTPLTAAENDIHDAGQVSILKELHDRLDKAVAQAYGWPVDLEAEEIVARVVALNAEQRTEEERGLIRWLRPEFQAPEQVRVTKVQATLDVSEGIVATAPAWPKDAPAQFTALRAVLMAGPATPSDIARCFKGAPARRMREMIETLVALGQARAVGAGRYMA